MSATPSPSIVARVAPSQWHAFGGVWRLTFWRFLVPGQLLSLAGMLAVLGAITFPTIPQGRANDYFACVTGFYLAFLVPVMAFLSGAGAIRDEMKSGSVDYVLTRPVRRTAFVVFKYLSHMACTQIVYLFPLGLLFALSVYREIPGVVDALPLLLAAQLLTVAAFIAFGFLCGVLTSRYLVVGLVYAGVVEVGVGQIPTQLSRLSMTHQVQAMLQPLLQVQGAFSTPAQGAFTTAGILLAFSAVMIALTAFYFSLQELAGSRARDM